MHPGPCEVKYRRWFVHRGRQAAALNVRAITVDGKRTGIAELLHITTWLKIARSFILRI